MISYYNAHTHRTDQEAGCLSVYNVLSHFDAVPEGIYSSAGLHPWYLDHIETDLPLLEQAIRLDRVIAIGECGLDKLKGPELSVQERVFRTQVQWANKAGKPLIIHCVRAYQEVFHILKEEQVQVPVVFHGFNKKPELAHQLLQAGYYLSFGKGLDAHHPHVIEVLSDTPADRFFLETDDRPVSIREMYRAAAIIRKTDEDAVILQLQSNFKNVFGV